MPANPHPNIDHARDASDGGPELLTLPMVRRRFVPIGERTLFRLIAAGDFPAADVRIGGRLRLWRRQTVLAWIDERSGADPDDLAGVRDLRNAPTAGRAGRGAA